MGKTRKLSWLVLGGILAGSGCNNQDVDHLARIGQLTASKMEALLGGPNGTFLTRWPSPGGGLEGAALDLRVGARLRWDKSLLNARIEVHAQDGQVILSGAVRDLAQRRRAVELAENTVGAEKVIDLLEISGQSP